MNKLPKILTLDIETAPITAYIWRLHDQHVNLNQIKQDWHLLMWAAKWCGTPAKDIFSMDNSHARDIRNDKRLIKGLWTLLDKADIVITQNGEGFDFKKFNARAVIHKLPPVRPYRSIDVMKEGRKIFGFTSHSLEYTSRVLNTRYKKSNHSKFPGMELWTEVLNGNQDAWKEMKKYCMNDVLSTEEKYQKIQAWIKTQNLAAYINDTITRCLCGSPDIIRKGFVYTERGKFQGYQCLTCGKRPRGSKNLFSTVKKKGLLKEGTDKR